MVHPHIRGVYRWTSNKACPGDGSSPHTWGIQGARPARRRFLRFIPTYVGYTFVAAPVFTAAAVHPHIRGAYQFPRPVPVPHIGSSPHTWGIRCSTAPTIDISRFIPTYVGHTAFGPQNAPAGSVHPHTRGAYTGSSRNVNSKIGSSPHTWGIHGACSDFSCIDRFIPTYVGHTGSAHVFCPPLPVHPHIRGVYDHLDLGIVGPARFIPTYVGYTPDRPHHPAGVPVHPHIRGVYCQRPVRP